MAVYAGLPTGPFVEDALLPIASGNSTETFKKAWEILALHFATRTGLEIISMRIAGIWGPLYHSMANLPSRLTLRRSRGRTRTWLRAGVECRLRKIAATCAT